MYYVVKFTGNFGFIKPWSAVRDEETYSQQFLSPSTIEGIEKKLFPETLSQQGVISKIKRYRLSYSSISRQQEQTQPRGFDDNKPKSNMAVITRGVMINPVLYLAFADRQDALQASTQHICLCRNEDILLPCSDVYEMSENEFNNLKGFEFRFGQSTQSFLVGYNRFNGAPMYGWIEVDGRKILPD